MKKSKIARGYFLNTIVIILLFTAFQILTSVKGSQGSFKLVLIPSIWQCCYLMVLAASLNLVLGFLGQLSLGHCGFMAIGAYTAALLSLACERAELFDGKTDPVFLLVLFTSVIAAGLMAALLSLLVGIPALRLKGDYLAIITLGFGMIIINIINNLPFCGQDGLALGSAGASLYKNGLGFGSKAKVQFIWFALLITIASLALMFMFVRSKYGRAIKAIRDDEIAASASGINTAKFKVMTFAYSAFFAGIAGALYACTNATLSTSSFAFTNGGILNSTFVVVMVVLGGMGSLTGSVIAAVIMFFINYEIKNGQWVNALPTSLSGIFEYPMLVYAVILIVVIMFRPKGIFGTYEFSLQNLIPDIRRALEARRTAQAEKKEVNSNA